MSAAQAWCGSSGKQAKPIEPAASTDTNLPQCSAYACLRMDVVHVLGACRSAVYDLKNERIYWLDPDARDALRRLTSGYSLDDLMTEAECRATFEQLNAMGLLVVERSPRGERLSQERVPPRSPRIAWLELGTLCNHRCVHCYNGSGPKADENPSEMDILLRAVDEIARCNIQSLKLIGGEPLAYFDSVVTLLERARDRGISNLSVHTNGTLLSRQRAARLAALGVQVDITVYGHTAELHEAVTATRFSFERTLGGLRNALAAGLPTTLNLIVLPSNEALLPAILEFFRRNFPAANIGYDYTRPIGRGRDLYRSLTLEHLNRYREHDCGFEGIDLSTFLMRKAANPCLHDKLMINGAGEVSPCIMQRDSCGSLKNQPLSDILKGGAFSEIADLSLDKIETCRDCEFRYACTDCRPIAQGLTGDLRAKPPECRYDPYRGEIAKREEERAHG